MKKIYVFEMIQHKQKSYTGCINPRELAKIVTRAELKTPQDAQRPIDPKRVEEISQFVNEEDGTLSTSIVISSSNDKIQVHKDSTCNVPGLYYIDFPETKEEFEEFKNCIDIMDGQHRLFSFLEEYVKLPKDEKYEITFQLYLKPNMRLRRLIFKNTNEKQKSVEANLLMWFREKLNMLSSKEQNYHKTVAMLAEENSSPLKGKIIMGAERIPGGFKGNQIISILDKNDIKHINNGSELDDEKMYSLITNYLHGWEDAVGIKIIDKDPNYAPFSKISGFRFMVLMLPYIFEQAIKDKKSFEKEYISTTIKVLFNTNGIEPEDIFNPNSKYIKEVLQTNPFAGETPTTLLAKEWGNKLKELSSGAFDPLA